MGISVEREHSGVGKAGFGRLRTGHVPLGIGFSDRLCVCPQSRAIAYDHQHEDIVRLGQINAYLMMDLSFHTIHHHLLQQRLVEVLHIMISSRINTT